MIQKGILIMPIFALTKTTLLDYPEHIAASIFFGGCNFRCPFCHNKDIVFASESLQNGSLITYTEAEILSFLQKRRNVLSGVCITGGEPTLYKDLPKFLAKIKELGYQIKLDTNGSNPELLRMLIQNRLIDYCAMDIKNSLKKYPQTIGIRNTSVPDASTTNTSSVNTSSANPSIANTAVLADLNKMRLTSIQKSVDILMYSDCAEFSYEFRTTVVQELHTEADLVEIAKWILGAPAYYLQSYVESDGVIQKGFHAYSTETMKKLEQICRNWNVNTLLRGV